MRSETMHVFDGTHKCVPYDSVHLTENFKHLLKSSI